MEVFKRISMKKIKVYVNIYQQGGKVGVSLFPFSSYAKARKETWDGWERIKTVCVPWDEEKFWTVW